MAGGSLYFSPRSRADLKSLPREAREAVLGDLESLCAVGVLPPPARVKKLKGAGGAYRLRTGDYRSIFRIRDGRIYVIRIVPRKELERSLAGLWGG